MCMCAKFASVANGMLVAALGSFDINGQRLQTSCTKGEFTGYISNEE